jgi:predicted phage-related endonuclease
MRTTIPKPDDRAEWLAARRPYVGASEIAALFDEHPFLTVAELATRKLVDEPDGENQAMARGRFLEDAVARWWAEDRGVTLTEPVELFVYGDAVCSTRQWASAG